jgi:hypothetical protein
MGKIIGLCLAAIIIFGTTGTDIITKTAEIFKII